MIGMTSNADQRRDRAGIVRSFIGFLAGLPPGELYLALSALGVLRCNDPLQ
jgi:hypothetical protein